MKSVSELICMVLFGVLWLAGIVLAKGVLSTAVAICMPPYAWYLVVERGMMMIGWA